MAAGGCRATIRKKLVDCPMLRMSRDGSRIVRTLMICLLNRMSALLNPPPKRKVDVKSSRTPATSLRARNVSPLRKKPRFPSAEKTQVGAIPASSARVKHLVGADSKKIGGMRNIRDVPLKPLADEFGDSDLLRDVVRARSRSPVEKPRDADFPLRSSGRLHQ